MYTMIPFRRNMTRELTRPLFADNWLRSFFDMSDVVSNAGFRVDVREDDAAFRLEAELPGVAKDKINVNVDEGILTISADLNEERSDENACYRYSERRTGHVERSFNLEGIDAEAITADYKNGVLMLNLPKLQPTPKKEARKIEITGTDNA